MRCISERGSERMYLIDYQNECVFSSTLDIFLVPRTSSTSVFVIMVVS
jgi:hypothetical protein